MNNQYISRNVLMHYFTMKSWTNINKITCHTELHKQWEIPNHHQYKKTQQNKHWRSHQNKNNFQEILQGNLTIEIIAYSKRLKSLRKINENKHSTVFKSRVSISQTNPKLYTQRTDCMECSCTYYGGIEQKVWFK